MFKTKKASFVMKGAFCYALKIRGPPFCLYLYKKTNTRWKMENKEKYYLYVEGQKIEVSKEIYTEYYHYKNKEDYFMKKLKTGKVKIDPLTKEKIYLPSREDSFDRLVDTYGSINNGNVANAEDIYMKKEEIASLYKAINQLTVEEKDLIRDLFFCDQTETAVAKKRGVSNTSIRYHKDKILKKLKKLY